MSDFETRGERIQKILGDNHYDIDKGRLIEKYLLYLKESMESSCRFIWIEDFDWEEKYIFWFWDEEEYEKLKKKNPSYTDIFEFIEFDELIEEEKQIFVKVKRISDKKRFVIALDLLEVKEKESKNFQLFEDYVYWYVNYN